MQIINLLVNFVNKKASYFSLEVFLKDRPEYKNSNVELYLSEEIKDDFTDLLQDRRYVEKFRIRLHYILKRKYSRNHYEKLKEYKDITEIKFKDKNNIRIYCKEYKTKDKVQIVIMAKLVKKKSQDINKKLKKLIEPIHLTNYELKKETNKEDQ